MANGKKTIKHLADQLEITTRTIKSWEQKGLIKPAKRNKWGHREYTDAEIKRYVEFVKKNNYFRQSITNTKI